jgi:hypothetical protein
MKRVTFAVAAGLIFSSLTISLSSPQSSVQAKPVSKTAGAPVGDACRNVAFKFTNRHNSGGQIRFQRIRFFNQANGDWQSEDVPNITCNQGATCTTNGNNLRDSEGENLTQFRLVYRYKPTGPGANWSDEVETGIFRPTNSTCRANKTYGPGSDGWVIQ